jgi:hypothetical protein
VEGPHRAWFADLAQEGLDQRVFRSQVNGGMTGWESVIDLLRGRDDEPVVTSYSVCDSFPNPETAGWKPVLDEDGEENWDAWYDLPDGEQWDTAMAGLRADKGSLREVNPANLRAPFGHEKSLFDVFGAELGLRRR